MKVQYGMVMIEGELKVTVEAGHVQVSGQGRTEHHEAFKDAADLQAYLNHHKRALRVFIAEGVSLEAHVCAIPGEVIVADEDGSYTVAFEASTDPTAARPKVQNHTTGAMMDRAMEAIDALKPGTPTE